MSLLLTSENRGQSLRFPHEPDIAQKREGSRSSLPHNLSFFGFYTCGWRLFPSIVASFEIISRYICPRGCEAVLRA